MIYDKGSIDFIADKVSVTDFMKKLITELFNIDNKLTMDFYPNKDLICISKNGIIIEQINLKHVVPFNVILSNVKKRINRNDLNKIEPEFKRGQIIN